MRTSIVLIVGKAAGLTMITNLPGRREHITVAVVWCLQIFLCCPNLELVSLVGD